MAAPEKGQLFLYCTLLVQQYYAIKELFPGAANGVLWTKIWDRFIFNISLHKSHCQYFKFVSGIL